MSFSNLASDPRVNRQIRLLSSGFRLTAAGFVDPQIPGVEFVQVPRRARNFAGKALAAAMLKLQLYEKFYWSSWTVRDTLRSLQGSTFDLILANDLTTLPLACQLNSRHGVLFDAHEYSPREFEESWKWRFFHRGYTLYLCETYLPKVAAMLTVCDGIADEYNRCYGVRPVVVHNAPYFSPLEPRAGVDGRIRLVHHGGAIPSRNIEVMIDMMKHVDDRFSLDLFLVPSNRAYLERLRKLAAKQPRVRILHPVPMPQLPKALNAYDVGVYLLQPNNFNNEHALPNKFFEFIQGRLAIAIGPSPEMARMVRGYGCGIVADDFAPQTLAQELKKLTSGQIAEYKMNAHRAANDLCYENASRALLDIVHKLVGNG
jgi:hypothetical protein